MSRLDYDGERANWIQGFSLEKYIASQLEHPHDSLSIGLRDLRESSAPRYKSLDGDTPEYCPINCLPKMPDARQIVARNLDAYVGLSSFSAPEIARTNKMRDLDYRLGVTLKTLFALHNSLDIWREVWNGSLAVSGSILLYLMDNIPNTWSTRELHSSDIDVFPTREICELKINGTVEIHGCSRNPNNWPDSTPSGDHVCRRVALQMDPRDEDPDNEVSENSMPGEHNYDAKTWTRERSPGDLMYDRLPHGIHLINTHPGSVNDFDHSFLCSYYTRGQLYVMNPASFASRVSLLSTGMFVPRQRIEKYRNLGYTVPATEELRGPPKSIRLNTNVDFGRRERWRVWTDCEWKLNSEHELTVTRSSKTSDIEAIKYGENPLTRAACPAISLSEELVVSIANCVLSGAAGSRDNM